MWLWARRAMLVMGYSALLITSMPQGAQSAQSFQCLGGTDSAIVNACGARWEAANIRAHIAVGKYGGAPPACLDKTAQLLDQEAAKWLASNSYVKFTRWPCGAKPAVASADDGVLSKACPNAAWSYNNRGAVRCKPRKPSPPHSQTLSSASLPSNPAVAEAPKSQTLSSASSPSYPANAGQYVFKLPQTSANPSAAGTQPNSSTPVVNSRNTWTLANFGASDGRTYSLIVNSTSVHAAADLSGKKVGIPSRGAAFDALVLWLENNRVVPAGVQFVQINLSQANYAVSSGLVDAAVTFSP